MNRESYMETVRQQYAEKVTAAYVQCEHDGQENFTELTAQLVKIKRQAISEGMSDADFDDIVFSALPDVRGKVELTLPQTAKKAA